MKSEPDIGATAPVPIPSDGLILLPVRDLVAFPGIVFPLAIGRAQSIAAVQQAVREERQLGIVLQRDPADDDPGPDGLYRIGCSAEILRYMAMSEGGHHLILQGVERFRILEILRGTPFPVARIQTVPERDLSTPEIEGRLMLLRERALELLELLPNAPQGLIESVSSADDAARLTDMAAAYSDLPANERQEILETLDLATRMDRVSRVLAHRIEVLKVTREIGRQTRAALDDRQREAVLREQMAAIQRQLGEEDDRSAEVLELSEAVAKAGMPEAVEREVRKELARYERMPEAAGEAAMLRTWLDWMIELPWKLPETSPIDLTAARAILDADHFGLEKIKARIVEFLAVRKLSPEGQAPILCFVGPPGTGKTSLGQSIARAMGRSFVRVSLGGLHDEAEIRGHRRTYIGALPGNVIQAIKRAGARNCVMMLDEIDKLGRGFQGDPSAALLEVLDPEQNATFHDNYLGTEFDLSKVVFLTTANQLDTIPGPLRDRMEVIALPGYTAEEKLEIASRYLVPRQVRTNGISEGQVSLSDAAIARIIERYTREAGVRSLEREIGAVLRHAAVKIAEGATPPVAIDLDHLDGILGPAKFDNEVAMRTGMPGVATGLAWTPVGGEILFVEASRAPGKGRLTLTGQLGAVMRESAEAALSLLKSRAAGLGLDPGLFETTDIHIHVPAGATPKDGPSAGVAIFVALASLLLDRRVRSDTAMTGEISLRGLVLPVGGIKEKVIAAAGAGLHRVLLPARNRRDYDEIPQTARNRLDFVWLETTDAALREALEPEAEKSDAP
ncbi:endopeptidase La [Histidinibacterium aquaticum]|uniref:Lon protease n=1 Tax=Histidinibacterium aquaticum TaxID=2613962 RepID=A0A5J5GAP9_9RHOB|nr:endopeptidase La [Histidinibacterium aquaticum]KAA9004983.1 endopeptidase La [Histidinibacterium aquaticum]